MRSILSGAPTTRATGEPWLRRESPLETRIMLQPLAEPAVLGSFALASGLIVFGTWTAGAWGDAASPKTFFPFVLLFAGIGQLAAALWGFSARNAVVASIHGAWSAFFLGWGVMWILGTAGTISIPALGTSNPSLGMWFLYLAVISWTTAFAALAKSPGGFVAQATLAAGATIAAPAFIDGAAGWEHAAGWVFVAAAAVAFVVGAAAMLGRAPGRPPLRPVEYEHGDPGVKVGQ
jgi:succinate-acetate transporter protein